MRTGQEVLDDFRNMPQCGLDTFGEYIDRALAEARHYQRDKDLSLVKAIIPKGDMASPSETERKNGRIDALHALQSMEVVPWSS